MPLAPRVIGLDFGARRIGVAITDPLGMLARPLATLDARDPAAVLAELKTLCLEHDATLIVVGVPINMDDSRGEAARKARAFARTLAPLGLPIEEIDERLTTVDAEERLKERGLDWRARKGKIDAAAACVILELWMAKQAKAARRAAAERAREAPPEPAAPPADAASDPPSP